MKARYVIGVFIGAVIGLALSYLYSQGEGAGITSNLGIGALIGAVVGLYIASAASASGKGSADGCGAERPRFG
jgi:uncharacterized membrane protein YeaQ/YmgE (transglycosylase-associated protein family)